MMRGPHLLLPPLALLALASAGLVGACGTIIGVDERHPGGTDASSRETPNDSTNAPGESTEDDGGAVSPDGSEPLRPLSLGQFLDPTLAVSQDQLLIDEIVDGRSKLTLIEKTAPTKPTTIYDQSADDPATRISTVGIARSEVWFTTVDGKLHHMNLAGTNPEVSSGASSSIVAASANTLWTASPDDLSNAPTLHWRGDPQLSNVPEASMNLDGPAMFTGATDDELALASSTKSGQWTLLRWRPFATQPLLTFATFDAYPTWVTFDSQRAIVYSEDEGTIVGWPRVANATPTTILTNLASKGTTALASDGTNLVIRSQTALSTCAIADCENTLRQIQTPTAFTKARYLVVDETWVYFFHSKSDSGPMTLVRVPR